jgi:hypothetical protein
VCVYPFVRSYEWYLLEDDERRGCSPSTARWRATTRRPRQHGRRFALGDYEWILAFEADELHRIVDLMRHLRGSDPGARARGGAVLHRRAHAIAELVDRLPTTQSGTRGSSLVELARPPKRCWDWPRPGGVGCGRLRGLDRLDLLCVSGGLRVSTGSTSDRSGSIR